VQETRVWKHYWSDEHRLDIVGNCGHTTTRCSLLHRFSPLFRYSPPASAHQVCSLHQQCQSILFRGQPAAPPAFHKIAQKRWGVGAATQTTNNLEITTSFWMAAPACCCQAIRRGPCIRAAVRPRPWPQSQIAKLPAAGDCRIRHCVFPNQLLRCLIFPVRRVAANAIPSPVKPGPGIYRRQ